MGVSTPRRGDLTFRVRQVIGVIQLTDPLTRIEVDAVAIYIQCTLFCTLITSLHRMFLDHVTLQFEIGLGIWYTTLRLCLSMFPEKIITTCRPLFCFI